MRMNPKKIVVLAGTLITIASLILSLVVTGAQENEKKEDGKPDILFYCSFDGTIKPEIQAGEEGYKGTDPAEFTKGLKGKALVTGNSKNAIYSLKGNINITEGTIKFWVMPIDWNADENLFHHFLRIPEPRPEQKKGVRVFDLLLYKYIDKSEVLAFGMGDELTNTGIITIPLDKTWSPGNWHQIAFTWDSKGATLYADGVGKSQRYFVGPPDTLIAQTFTVGGPYFVENKTLTAIDELYILSRKLSDQEINQAYKTELVEGVMTNRFQASPKSGQ